MIPTIASLATAPRLHTEIPADAIALFRHSVRLIDARDRIRPEAVAALLPTIEPIHEPFAPAPLIFPYTEPQATTLPAEQSGFVVRGRTIRSAYLDLIWHVMTYGAQTGTQHSSDQRELLDVMTVITDEPAAPEQFSYAPWMPFTRESLGVRQPDGTFSGYLGQFVQAGHGGAGVSYTYGDRLRAFGEATPLDQLATMADDLQASGQSRRAVAVLWEPARDAGAKSPPCLVLVQARLRPDSSGGTRLYLTAYFRSHDIYRAWASNAYGLQALQLLLTERLTNHAPVAAGDLVIISHSAHIYTHDWEAAETLLAHHHRRTTPRLERDPRGSFVISVEPPDIVVQHFTPDGTHLRTVRGGSADALAAQLAPFIGLMSHALYLGQELHRAELALRVGRPDAFRQDRALDMAAIGAGIAAMENETEHTGAHNEHQG
ncbi:MAG: hypothetical protein HC876_09290 [Chloroflexaceae bacterium]|nr:hypothetical protein [Chloroflexaceae bacterium]